MRFGYENSSSSMEKTNDINENSITSEQLSETEEVAEDFEACAINEGENSKMTEINSETLENAEDDYEDCQAKVEEMEEENPELAEEDDDYGDCGRETEGQYVAEVSYIGGAEESEAEIQEKLQDAYDRCEDPENMQELKAEINENNENVKAVDAELIEKPETVEHKYDAEDYEAAKQEVEEAEEQLEEQQEAAEVYQEELENEIEENKIEENKIEENNDATEETEKAGVEEIENSEETERFDTEDIEQEELTEEVAEQVREETGDEVTETEAEEIKEEIENKIEADAEDGEVQAEEVEEIVEDQVEEKVEELEEPSQEEVGVEELQSSEGTEEIEVENIEQEEVVEESVEEVEQSAEVELTEEETKDIEKNVESEIETRSEEGEIEAEEVQEIVDEQVEEKSEELETVQEETSEEIEAQAEEIVEEREDLTEDELKEEIKEETKEAVETDEVSDEEVEEIVEEKEEEIEETLEDQQEEKELEENVEEIKEEVEEQAIEAEEQKEEKSFSERLETALDKEEPSTEELRELREENSENLANALKEQEQAAEELSKKFEDAVSKPRGTEEYRKALDEYNDFKAYKTDLDEKIGVYKQQQDLLEKKSLELRDAQLQKGNEAVEAAMKTQDEVKLLQQRYDESYYSNKPNSKELQGIKEDNCTAIKELTDEKDAMKLAMDAKMDEIKEYVYSHNMGRYDTSRDAHYQQLTAEYLKLKESYDRTKYSIVKLDENNKSIAEYTGEKYETMVDRPKPSKITEVNDGTDIPGETNYFIDETKTAEVLQPFAQTKWEQLSIQEQKVAIEKLADFNADILGVEDKPKIIYYHVEDPTDFGGYSAKQNAIYINEYNMKDAAETADTISHEYRHKYQHERAEKLENERDLEYKENFEDYISPDDDYQAYKDQLVESDARAYAKVIKEKIDSYEDNSQEPVIPLKEQSGMGADFRELHPEKGTVFEKISVEDLPEDFKQKDRIKYKETLEIEELNEVRERVAVSYKNGKEVWGKLGIKELESYKEHNDIEKGHIEHVRVKSLEAADTLEEHFKKNNYDGLYSPEIDKKAVELMALYHDTGMDGNIKAEDYAAEKEAYLANESIKEAYIAKILAKKEKEALRLGKEFDRVQEEKAAAVKFEKEGFETHFRPDHSLESAIHVLRDREFLKKYDVNVDEIALGCLAHSKSNSGLTEMHDEKRWEQAINCLEKRVEMYNETHPEEQIHFDKSFLVKENGTFEQEKLAQMRSEVITLRIGDANGHDTNSRISQTGKNIEFSLEKKASGEELPADIDKKIETKEYEPFFVEVQNAEVFVDGVKLDNSKDSDPKGIARMFAVGEGNFKALSCEPDEHGNIKQTFELCDGNAFPLSTQKCIQERLEEYHTAKPMEFRPVIVLGSDCSDEVYESYNKFKEEVAKKYKVELEVVR